MKARAPRQSKSWDLFERQRLDCERVTELEILQIVIRCEGGQARQLDLLKYLYPGQESGFGDNQIINAQWAFVKLAQKGLLYTIALDEHVTMKIGSPQPDFAFYLSEAGRHNLMTHATGAMARGFLDQIEEEK